jgi:hypothetical protein
MASFDELISPELVLVCPDLRARAIGALPPRQPWLPSRPRPGQGQLRRVLPAAAARPEWTASTDATLARAVGGYVLARAGDLLAIMAGIALFVLGLAAVAGAMRG